MILLISIVVPDKSRFRCCSKFSHMAISTVWGAVGKWNLLSGRLVTRTSTECNIVLFQVKRSKKRRRWVGKFGNFLDLWLLLCFWKSGHMFTAWIDCGLFASSTSLPSWKIRLAAEAMSVCSEKSTLAFSSPSLNAQQQLRSCSTSWLDPTVIRPRRDTVVMSQKFALFNLVWKITVVLSTTFLWGLKRKLSPHGWQMCVFVLCTYEDASKKSESGFFFFFLCFRNYMSTFDDKSNGPSRVYRSVCEFQRWH